MDPEKHEIQKNVLEWMKINEELKEIRKNIKDLNEKKKSFEENIIQQMKLFKVNQITLASGGTIKKNTSKVKKAMNKNDINSFIFQTLQNDDLAQKLIDKLTDNREIVEKEYLKHC